MSHDYKKKLAPKKKVARLEFDPVMMTMQMTRITGGHLPSSCARILGSRPAQILR